MKKVLVLVNLDKDKDLTFTKNVISFLNERNVQTYVENEIFPSCSTAKLIDVKNIKEIDFAIVLGGDGTILIKAHEYQNDNLKFLGINLGRVGCLTEGEPENYQDVIEKVLLGNYKVEQRTILKEELVRDNKVIQEMDAFNEVTINRGNGLKMLQLNVQINESNDASFFADGVIVATPTGSSAYCLSSGGPLLIPTSKSFVITPICPQLRTITSLVVDGDDIITISINEQQKLEISPHLEIDGNISVDFLHGDKLVLRKSPRTLNIIKINFNKSLYEPIFKVTNTFIN